MSGAYVLQSNRANFNKNKVDPTCMIVRLILQILYNSFVISAIIGFLAFSSKQQFNTKCSISSTYHTCWIYFIFVEICQEKFTPYEIPIISSRESNGIAIKLKVMSGAYILQSNRANFNKNKGDPTCMI
jgi:hypothetical protein